MYRDDKKKNPPKKQMLPLKGRVPKLVIVENSTHIRMNICIS
jgi:hypothetical protein